MKAFKESLASEKSPMIASPRFRRPSACSNQKIRRDIFPVNNDPPRPFQRRIHHQFIPGAKPRGILAGK